VLTGLNGILLGGQPKGIIPHRMQHIKTTMTFVTGINIGSDIPQRMPYMKPCTRWVGKHIEHIIFGARKVGSNLIGPVVLPVLPPPGFDFAELIFHNTISRHSRRGKRSGHAPTDVPVKLTGLRREKCGYEDRKKALFPDAVCGPGGHGKPELKSKGYFCGFFAGSMTQENGKMARKTLRTSYISTVISISLVLFMIGTLGVLVLHARKISNYVKENVQLSVMLMPEAKENDIKKLMAMLEKTEAVKEAAFISKEEAAESLKSDLGEDFVEFLGYNPLLASVDVKLNAEFTDLEQVEALKSKIASFAVVKEVYYQQSLIDMINRNIRTFGMIIIGFSAILLFIAAALINNTIRLALYSRRLLIKSMKLVGATRGFIRRPFVLSGIMQGFIGAMIANILLGVLLFVARKKIPDLATIQDYEMIIKLMGAVVVTGIFISGISTFFAVNKYLNRNSQDLY
jgi:cell division transport system permease protein